MTTIFDNGSFWIESFNVTINSAANIGAHGVDFTLDKPGHFLGGSATSDASDPELVGFQALTLRQTGSVFLDYGDAITQARVTVWQVDAIARAYEIHVILFMGK